MNFLFKLNVFVASFLPDYDKISFGKLLKPYQQKFKSFKILSIFILRKCVLATNQHFSLKIKIFKSWSFFFQTKCFYLFSCTEIWYNFVWDNFKTISNTNLKVWELSGCKNFVLATDRHFWLKMKIFESLKFFFETKCLSLLFCRNMIKFRLGNF